MIRRFEVVYPGPDPADEFLIYYQPRLRFEGAPKPKSLSDLKSDSLRRVVKI